MVNSFCKTENFEHITQVREGVHIVRFSDEVMVEEVYEDYQPTGRYEDTGLTKFTEEIVMGEVTLDKVIAIRKQEIDKYDVSDDVNSFTYNGKQMWFDKVTRTCINYSMEVEKNAGKTETTLYDNEGNAHVLPIDLALGLFAQLELYAKACYNVTQAHKAAVSELTSVEDALAYNIKADYPEKLVIDNPEGGE